MSTEVICALISGFAATLCAGFAAWATVRSSTIAKQIQTEQKRTDARAERRALESRLSMDMMYASCSLALTTAKKMAGQHTNGDVEEAMEAAVKARAEYESFVRDQASRDVAKV